MPSLKTSLDARRGVQVSFLFRRALGILTGAILFFMMALTITDVFARFILSSPLPGTFELMEFSLAIVVFSALPLVTWDREHISVSLFDSLFRGFGKRIQQIIITGVSGVAMAIISSRMWYQGVQLNETGATTGFLLWPRAPIAYFMSIFAALSFLVLIGLFFQACTGNLDPVNEDKNIKNIID